VHASVIQFRNERRGITFTSLAAEGAAFAAGFGGTGAEPAGAPAVVLGGTGGLDSSLLIGISLMNNELNLKIQNQKTVYSPDKFKTSSAPQLTRHVPPDRDRSDSRRVFYRAQLQTSECPDTSRR